MLGTMKKGEKPKTLHTCDYNYNDNMIATGSYFYLKIVEDRLKINNLLDEWFNIIYLR